MKTLTEKALSYLKGGPYIHVKVDDEWYLKTREAKSYLAGAREMNAEAAEVAENHLKHPIARDIWEEIKKLGEA
jgi:hypothetical protein